jgi:hypothetical protein
MTNAMGPGKKMDVMIFGRNENPWPDDCGKCLTRNKCDRKRCFIGANTRENEAKRLADKFGFEKETKNHGR